MKGFTLIEIVLTIIIAGVIMATVGPLLSQTFLSLQKSRELWTVSAGQMMWQNRFGREVQGSTAFTATTPTILTFQDSANITTDFRVTGGNLLLSKGGATGRALATNVTSYSFTYWDQALLATTNPANARCVAVNVTITDAAGVHNSNSTWCSRNIR